MKIFVTGATGYIGQRLANLLSAKGHTVHALVRNTSFARQVLCKEIRLFAGSITDYDAVYAAMAGCEQVYHVAGLSRLWVRDNEDFFKVNVGGTLHILQSAVRHRVNKVVFTSSCGVFGNSLKYPLTETDPRLSQFNNDYDLSKHLAERTVRKYAKQGLTCVIVNPSRVFGTGLPGVSNSITRLLERVVQGKPVIMPSAMDVIANYAYLPDVVQGHLLAMERGVSGEQYILGGENRTYRQVIGTIKEYVNRVYALRLSPAMLKIAAHIDLLLSHAAGREPRLTPNVVERITRNAAFDCSKAVSELGYTITPFREAIRQTLHDLQNESICKSSLLQSLPVPVKD